MCAPAAYSGTRGPGMFEITTLASTGITPARCERP